MKKNLMYLMGMCLLLFAATLPVTAVPYDDVDQSDQVKSEVGNSISQWHVLAVTPDVANETVKVDAKTFEETNALVPSLIFKEKTYKPKDVMEGLIQDRHTAVLVANSNPGETIEKISQNALKIKMNTRLIPQTDYGPKVNTETSQGHLEQISIAMEGLSDRETGKNFDYFPTSDVVKNI